jgi:hypothetical protein
MPNVPPKTLKEEKMKRRAIRQTLGQTNSNTLIGFDDKDRSRVN